jgi:hypothetical protein
VVTTTADQVVVLSRPLLFDGLRLSLGEPRLESATVAIDGIGTAGALRPGDHVSLHWHWVCDRLSRRQLGNLRRQTMRQLHITNDLVRHPGPAVAMS